jgi:hypothetical protein
MNIIILLAISNGTWILIGMAILPIIVFGYFHLLFKGFFNKFKRKRNE